MTHRAPLLVVRRVGMMRARPVERAAPGRRVVDVARLSDDRGRHHPGEVGVRSAVR